MIMDENKELESVKSVPLVADSPDYLPATITLQEMNARNRRLWKDSGVPEDVA